MMVTDCACQIEMSRRFRFENGPRQYACNSYPLAVESGSVTAVSMWRGTLTHDCVLGTEANRRKRQAVGFGLGEKFSFSDSRSVMHPHLTHTNSVLSSSAPRMYDVSH